MFAAEQAGVMPDIMTLSKALTGGTLGLAATLAAPKIFEAFRSDRPEHALMHGPTFMANPLACAAACASLDLFEQNDRLAQIETIKHLLSIGLEPCRCVRGVRDVRVLGAIGVVELEAEWNLADLTASFIEAGVWVRPFRSVIYLTPAFTITAQELNLLTHSIVTILEAQSRSYR
jgi:adenosylmethionine-8-amino-7-oxononanoate aminotransferase